MSIEYSSTNDTSGQTFNGTFSFHTVVTGSTYWKVIVNESLTESSSETINLGYEFKIESSGTVDWYYTNYPGVGGINSTAGGDTALIGAFTEFDLEAGSNPTYSNALLTQYFHSTGTGSVSIPTVTIDYTTYAANNPNETFNSCGGSFTYSEFNVEIGTIQGTSIQVLVLAHLKGSSGSTTFDYTIQLTGATLV
jgi:hypothetical protein